MDNTRMVDGFKVGFVDSESYFSTLGKPSMHSVSKDTGADVVLLLAAGKKPDDLTDDMIREVLRQMTVAPITGGSEG